MRATIVGVRSPISRQRGQAAVLALLLMGAVVIAGLMLFTSGQRASSRMLLQNAADAGAYSVAQIEARDLNFAAYMNRAIIANQVTLGQFVSLVAWARYLTAMGAEFNAIGAALAVPTAGVSELLLGSLGDIYDSVGSFAETTYMSAYALVGAISKALIDFYSSAEQAFHLVTAYLVLSAVMKVIPANDPDASLSPFGYAALLAHESSYLNTFAPWQSAKKTGAGAGRMAAMVQASRDGFLRYGFFPPPGVGWQESFAPPPVNAGQLLQSVAGIFGVPKWVVDAFTSLFDLSAQITFSFSAGTFGGGEYRYVNSPQGDHFNWSGAYAAGVGFTGTWQLHFYFPGVKIGKTTIFPSINQTIGGPLPPGYGEPFGGGAAQIGGSQNSLDSLSMLPGAGIPSSQVQAAYGAAPVSPGWLPDVVPGISADNLDAHYYGLPGFVDVPPYSENQGFKAPYVLIAVTAPAPAPFIASGDFATPAGDAPTPGGSAPTGLGALSKAEVYFSRPNDLGYFARPDNLTEQGNPYDPYWQARLVATTFNDRVLTLAGQQQQYWGAPTAKQIVNSLQQAKADLCGTLAAVGGTTCN